MRHLSCGHGRPLGARIFRRRFQGFMVVHCLLLQDADRLVLVDSGLSESELERPRRLGAFARGLGLSADPSLAAKRRLLALGLRPDQVTDIVLTHLDLDHAGGLQDFPDAVVHVHERELDAAQHPRGYTERLRYRPRQWRDAHWRVHGPPEFEDLDDAPTILEVDEQKIALVPLFGHTRGHCGVLIRSGGRRVLHVGDTYYDHSELEDSGSLVFRWFRNSVDADRRLAARSRSRVVRWKREHADLHVLSSHDPSELPQDPRA